MQTPRLRLLQSGLSTVKNKGKGSILYWSFFTMLETWRPFIEGKSNQPRRPQLPTRANHLPNSKQGSFCGNHRYFLCSFFPVDDRMVVPFLRIFSSHSGIDVKSYDVCEKVEKICKLVQLGEANMEDKLTEMNVELSSQLVRDVLRNTSEHGHGHAHSALRFFTWAKSQPEYSHNSALYNEMISMAGSSGDFEAIGCLIEEMIAKGHSLTEGAFSFMLSSPSIRIIAQGLVDTFIKLKYSAQMAAFDSLVSVLCRRNFVVIATWVFQGMTDRGEHVQVSCYNALIAARCRQGHLMEARRLLDVMKKSGCEPNTDSYNYLLGTICKKGKIADACHLLDLMEKSGHQPNPITYEILICHACKTSKMNSALEFLNKMFADGLKPRYSTYAAFIKGYFYSKEFEEAYNFVIETTKKDPSANSMNYMLLASLFEKSGMMLEARSVLLQMIDKGLIPSFSLCKKVSMSLFQNGNQVMAEELLCKFGDIRNALNKKQKHHEK